MGAELQTLRDLRRRDYLWNGDAAWWTGRAPILFPIVGALAGDTLRVDGVDHAMAKHGFNQLSNSSTPVDSMHFELRWRGTKKK